ncbi:MAG TPA: hypothetical protein VFQ57_09195 [Sphingomonas sp.]|nr:hypothetical protein [Sphingomonas sp.]
MPDEKNRDPVTEESGAGYGNNSQTDETSVPGGESADEVEADPEAQ